MQSRRQGRGPFTSSSEHLEVFFSDEQVIKISIEKDVRKINKIFCFLFAYLNLVMVIVHISKYLFSVTRLGDLLDFGHISVTFLGNFCIGVKSYHFSREIIFGQLL